MPDKDDLKVKLVRKLASKNITGKNKADIDVVKQWGVATHEQGAAKEALEELARNPDAPVEQYGGRDQIRLSSMEDAKEYIVENDGELPWGLRD